MKIEIKTPNGKSFEVETESTTSVHLLKSLITSHVNLTQAEQKLTYDNRILSDEFSLQDEGIKDGATFVVIPKRKPIIISQPQIDQNDPIPDKATILRYTSSMSPESIRRAANARAPSGRPTRLQDLLESMAMFNPSYQDIHGEQDNDEEDEDANDQTSMNDDDEEDDEAVHLEADPALLAQLKDLGFPEERSRKALIINRQNIELAMEWMLMHEADADIDVPLTEEQLAAIARTMRSGRRGRNGASAAANAEPNPESIQRLKEMGFNESDIIEALRITHNDEEAACSWLLGDRNEVPTSASAASFMNILLNPAVQRALSEPRVLQAFQTIISNPAAATQYLADPEIGPLLQQFIGLVRNLPSS